ncbi:MAG: HD domain-containing protein [Candidatus Berkelbacteria bacterium]|nr:HD domain-containing protein [Candidatus Berkelbacteria bacterium]
MKQIESKKFKEAVLIVKKLEDSGFEAYFAGGSVRDMLLGIEPTDFDISTSATPDQIEKLFSRTVAIGKKFGVILVVGDQGQYEVTTFRGEAEYKDKRRPSKVYWVKAKEDAKRRDFTINGLFFNPLTNKIVDNVGGQKDLKNKVIRFIGDPDKRIKEDNLRILRAVRFKNVLNFKYDSKTKSAIQKYASLIQNVSKERIKLELDKILENKSRANGILDLSELGILKHILPDIDKMKNVDQPHHFHAEGDVFEHTILSLQKLPPKTSKIVAWATLLHDVGKPSTFKMRDHPKYGLRETFYGHIEKSAEIAEKITKRLKFSKEEQEKVVFLVREHLKHKDIPLMKLARQRKWLANPWMIELFMVWKADGEASWLGKKEKIDLSLYEQTKVLYEEELKRPKPPKPFLNGNEVMKILKIKPGPEVGKILEKLEEVQLEEKIKSKQEAIEFIKNI